MDIWKEFEHNEISHSGAHYLMSVQKLIDSNGYTRISDIAKEMHITPGSASIMIKSLRQKGYLEEDQNRFLKLSEEGNRVAHSVASHRQILITFLQDVLKLEPEKAEIDACKIEHLISTDTGDRLLLFLQFLLSDQTHGKKFLELYWNTTHATICDLESCPVCEGSGECLVGNLEKGE